MKLQKEVLKKVGLFASGVVFGTAGIKVLSSDDAKKVYTHSTAAVLRAKTCVMKVASTVQENAEDILAGAKQINEDRELAAEEAAVEDAEEVTAEETAERKRQLSEICNTARDPRTHSRPARAEENDLCAGRYPAVFSGAAAVRDECEGLRTDCRRCHLLYWLPGCGCGCAPSFSL